MDLSKLRSSIERDSVQRRPNKLAKGMSYTRARGRARTAPKDAVLSLLVNGTTDRLRGLTYLKEKIPCECCGAKSGNTKYRLNDAGRRRLRLNKIERGR